MQDEGVLVGRYIIEEAWGALLCSLPTVRFILAIAYLPCCRSKYCDFLTE